MTLMNKLSPTVVARLNPEAAVFVRFQEDIRCQIRQLQGRIARGEVEKGPNRTIFHELLTGSLPDEEKKLERIWQEGQIVVGAGTETTAWTLSATLFYVLDNPEIPSKLQSELRTAMPDPNERVSWNHLEQLPYLSAVICEGLRLSYGVSTRLQRINPTSPLHFQSRKAENGVEKPVHYEIPTGTPVGMSATLVHTNAELFPEPLCFVPERWLDDEGKRHNQLDKYLLAFSRGSRQCLGIK